MYTFDHVCSVDTYRIFSLGLILRHSRVGCADVSKRLSFAQQEGQNAEQMEIGDDFLFLRRWKGPNNLNPESFLKFYC